MKHSPTKARGLKEQVKCGLMTPKNALAALASKGGQGSQTWDWLQRRLTKKEVA